MCVSTRLVLFWVKVCSREPHRHPIRPARIDVEWDEKDTSSQYAAVWKGGYSADKGTWGVRKWDCVL